MYSLTFKGVFTVYSMYLSRSYQVAQLHVSNLKKLQFQDSKLWSCDKMIEL